MPPDHRFQHHGEPVETREQWAARQAAAAHAQELAAAQRRRAEAAVEAKRREAEAAAAKRTEAASRRAPAPPSIARRPATARRSAIAAGLVVLCLTGGIVAWSLRGPSKPDLAVDPDPPAAISRPGPKLPRVRDMGKPDSRSAEREVRSDVRRGASWTDAPTIAPQSDGWWCLCYKTHTDADHTACRRLPEECSALMEMVETQGSSSIRPGSVSPLGCRFIPGPYPWTRLGHRSAWTTSSFAGATQAPSVCAL